MSILRRLPAFLLLGVVIVSMSERALARRNDASDRMRAEQLGKLVYTKLSLQFDGVPARDAFKQLSTALSLAIIGRYLDDRIGRGIDPEAPITLYANNIDGLTALELMLEQCADYDPVTWQLRDGFVEIGTKDRLSSPSVSEVRTYSVRDLMLEAPYFQSPPLNGGLGAAGRGVASIDTFYDHPYQCASLTRPVEVDQTDLVARKRPEELMLELIHGIVETIEPGNWDDGTPVPDTRDNSEQHDDSPRAARGAGRYTGSDKIARIRAFEDRIIITAPDYIHRQINGYPTPIKPAQLTVEECLDRSARASTDDARMTVLGIENAVREHVR